MCIEKFFDMKKAEAKEAIEIYRKFPPIGDRVKGFLQVAKVCSSSCLKHVGLCLLVLLKYTY